METVATVIAIAWLLLKAAFNLLSMMILLSIISCILADHPVQVPFIGITISPTRK